MTLRSSSTEAASKCWEEPLVPQAGSYGPKPRTSSRRDTPGGKGGCLPMWTEGQLTSLTSGFISYFSTHAHSTLATVAPPENMLSTKLRETTGQFQSLLFLSLNVEIPFSQRAGADQNVGLKSCFPSLWDYCSSLTSI